MDQQSQHAQQHHHHQQQQPQDVLAEARKNLQVLIDSGLSRDLLHQLVDDSQTLQLAFPALQSQSLQQNPTPSLLQQHQPQTSQAQQPQQPQSSVAHVPPPPQCPPPPIPSAAQQQQHRQQQHQSQSQSSSQQQRHQAQSMLSPITTTTSSSVPSTSPSELKTEDVTGLAMLGYPGPPTAPFAHRPRISVSSTSSGSSGHASVFSNLSNHSAMSWASAGSNCHRMQAPLPLPPQMTSPTGAPLMASGAPGPVGTSSASLSKHNIYWCTSCETSFKRKYDWKRHEDEFHERWRKYPCPEPGCNRSFWGSNSFNQHHKQCHGCTTCPHAEKVVKFLRKRKYWACGFCSALHPARERHVEHVARHFESGLTKGDWMHSRVIYGLLHQPLIHEAWESLLRNKEMEQGGRRPRFSWHPSKTGRAQGFLEKENPGQLQDLLEFFSDGTEDAKRIAETAYSLADIVVENVQHTPPHFPNPAPMSSYQDPRMSFATVPSHQSLLPSDPNGHNPYGQGFNTMFMGSQPYPPRTNGPSPPESTSHSPLASNHSPIASSTHSVAVKQEAQAQHQHSTQNNDSTDGLMEFEYSPAPIVFDDWESIHTQSMDETSPSQPNTSQPGWNNLMYFGDPRVAS